MVLLFLYNLGNYYKENKIDKFKKRGCLLSWFFTQATYNL